MGNEGLRTMAQCSRVGRLSSRFCGLGDGGLAIWLGGTGGTSGASSAKKMQSWMASEEAQ